jgi:TonB family protein
MRNHPTETRLSWVNLITTAGVAALLIGTLTGPRLQAQSGPLPPGAYGGGPACLYCPAPQYTKEALKAKFQGAVILQVIIQPDGHATNIRVVKAGPPGLFGLEEKAVEAVKTWRFKPAVGPSGRPVAAVTPIEVTFRLPQAVGFSQ